MVGMFEDSTQPKEWGFTKGRLYLASRHPGQILWHAPSKAFGVVQE